MSTLLTMVWLVIVFQNERAALAKAYEGPGMLETVGALSVVKALGHRWLENEWGWTRRLSTDW